MNNKYLIVGGDLRNAFLYKLLKDDGKNVCITGFSNLSGQLDNIENIDNIDIALKDSNIIITAIPAFDEHFLPTPYNEKKININAFINKLDNQLVISGKLHTVVSEKLKQKNINVVDILQQESFAILNAIPTSEGAIQIAMENMNTTIHSNKTLVLGFGRIAKLLAKSLYAMAADLYIATNIHSEETLIKSYGYKFLHLDNMNIEKFHLIINTIPFVYLNEQNLSKLNKNCLIIDVASFPYGVDFKYAKANNINAILASNLPGKVAPLTVAKYIKETIEQLGY